MLFFRVKLTNLSGLTYYLKKNVTTFFNKILVCTNPYFRIFLVCGWFKDILQNSLYVWAAESPVVTSEHPCLVMDESNGTPCIQLVSFTRMKATFTDYNVPGTVLIRADRMKDLSVLSTSTPSPNEHIHSKISRSYSLFGVICRCTKHFESPEPLLVLYKSLLHLFWNLMIWAP